MFNVGRRVDTVWMVLGFVFDAFKVKGYKQKI